MALLAYDRIRNAVADRASPGHAANYESSYLAPEMVERLLRERPPDWFPDYDAMLLKSLKDAIAEGEKLQGSKLSRWDYGQFNELTVENPVFGAAAADRQIFQHRAGADERLVHHREANHAAAGTVACA